MNNKGQVFFYTFMIGVLVIVLAMALAFPVRQATETARNDSSGDFTGLNCSNPPDMYYRAACVVTDITLPYFIIGLLAIGGAVIGAKIIFT